MSGETAAVVVVGSLNVDLVARAAHLPLPGQTLIGHGFSKSHGGKGANQAVAAARLGARVAMIGCIGDDDHGRQLCDALQAEGVDVAAVSVDVATPSGVALIVVADDGENSIVVAPGANHRLLPPQIDRWAGRIAAAAVVVLQQEVPEATVLHVLRLARQGGALTVLNAAPVRPLPDTVYPLVDWLVVNETEAAALAGVEVEQPAQAVRAATELLARGSGHVVVTLGAKGVVHAYAQGTVHHAARPVHAVDTTGAGDTFVGALAAALSLGEPPAVALQWGQAAAAVAVTRHGAQAAMPTRRELGDMTA